MYANQVRQHVVHILNEWAELAPDQGYTIHVFPGLCLAPSARQQKLYAEAPTHLQQWHSPLPYWLRSSMATCGDTLALARLRPSCRAIPDPGRIAVNIPELSVKVAGAIDTDLSAHGMRDMTKGFVTRRRGTIP